MAQISRFICADSYIKYLPGILIKKKTKNTVKTMFSMCCSLDAFESCFSSIRKQPTYSNMLNMCSHIVSFLLFRLPGKNLVCSASCVLQENSEAANGGVLQIKLFCT